MEGAADESQFLAVNDGVSLTDFNKVLYCFGHNLSIHIDGNSSCWLSSDVDVQEDFVSDVVLSSMSVTFSSSERERAMIQARRMKLIFINYQI
jgi:hypothetical protein